MANSYLFKRWRRIPGDLRFITGPATTGNNFRRTYFLFSRFTTFSSVPFLFVVIAIFLSAVPLGFVVNRIGFWFRNGHGLLFRTVNSKWPGRGIVDVSYPIRTFRTRARRATWINLHGLYDLPSCRRSFIGNSRTRLFPLWPRRLLYDL